jgi:hypothetical protein
MRALYRWRVMPGRDEEFARLWVPPTKFIRANVPGAPAAAC